MATMSIPASVTGTVLQLGSMGPAVTTLQQALNAALPSYTPLWTDGQFGGLTSGRVKTFQGNQKLSADGVVGPNTWNALVAALGGVVAAVTGADPTAAGTEEAANTGSAFDALRPQIIAIARQHIGRVDFTQFNASKPRGLDFLIEMFEDTAGVRFPESAFKSPIGSGWEWRPYSGGPGSRRIDWCGVFAVYCYRRAGVPIRWAGGRPDGPLRLRPISAGVPAGMRPGDIGVTGTNNHHFIVETKSAGASPALTTIDGNTAWGHIKQVSRAANVARYYEFTM
jgi:Putative peptidoglycan binding domain